MQFKHPELLYALLLLLIPIIVHLFQLRRFQKVDFTNVAFLKSVTIQTRKSSQLKKWLTLITRLILLAAVIFAFAQPYLSKNDTLKLETESVIYLDNSFSMQAKGAQGELLKRAVQDILESDYEDETLTIFTNNSVVKNNNSKLVKNELLQLDYSTNQLNYNAAILKGKQFFSNDESTQKNLILISDFQQSQNLIDIPEDSSVSTHIIQLKPVNTNNVSIDSLYISRLNASTIELTAQLNGNIEAIENMPISLFNEENLLAKSSVENTTTNTTKFSIPNNAKINGKLTIDDANLQFDNTLFFNINERSKINVLVINEGDDQFLKRIFTDDEFNLQVTSESQLNFNDISKQNCIILNELKAFPIALSNALQDFTSKGGNVLIIPSTNADVASYNQGLSRISNASLSNEIISDKSVTTINFSHPIFDAVFDKQVSNFQYPIVHNYYKITAPESAILRFEDNSSFLTQSNNVFIFAASLTSANSNFIDSPLIVPTLYNIGRQSLQLPKLYYNIGEDNSFDVNTTMQQDDILKLKMDDSEVIPQQQTFSNKVTVNTNETPEIANTYAVVNNDDVLEHVSFNYNRKESNLTYQDLSSLENVSISNSLPQLLTIIKTDNNINALWKWFAIFALLFLIIEMLILKYFK